MTLSVVLAVASHEFADISETINQGEGFSVCGRTTSLGRGVRLVRKKSPDLFLMEMGMADPPTMKAIRTVCSTPRTRVVVLCRVQEAASAVVALEAGANGYLFSDAAPSDVLRTLKLMARH